MHLKGALASATVIIFGMITTVAASAAPSDDDYTIYGHIDTPAGVARADYLANLRVETHDCTGTVDLDRMTGDYTITDLEPGFYTLHLYGTATVNGITMDWEDESCASLSTPGTGGTVIGKGVTLTTPLFVHVNWEEGSASATAPVMTAPAFGRLLGVIDLTDADLSWLRLTFTDAVTLHPPDRLGYPVPAGATSLAIDEVVPAGDYLIDVSADGYYVPLISDLWPWIDVYANVGLVTVPDFDGVDMGTIYGAAGLGITPVAPAESTFDDDNRGDIVAPAEVKPGDRITVSVGDSYAGSFVRGWLFSSPVSLGSSATDTFGNAVFTVPEDVEPGAHRIALTSLSGRFIGWDDITVTKAAVSPKPSVSPSEEATPAPTQSTPPTTQESVTPEPSATPNPIATPQPSSTGANTEQLAETGSRIPTELLWGAAMMVFSGLVLLRMRKRPQA